MKDQNLKSQILVSMMETLQKHLPLIAEEGGIREKVSAEFLSERLSEGGVVAPEAVQAYLKLVEEFYFRMGWLDPFEFERNNWQFVSFPASLAAQSWLAVMSSPDGCWYPPGWWSDEANLETQRKMLKAMEEQRIENSGTQKPQTIRMIYVAWALIKLENCFLLCEREDKERDGIPHYVMAGGRLNASDVKRQFSAVDQKECLKILQTPNSEEAHQALDITLGRELEEEVGLKPEHYSIESQHVLRLNPFHKLEGARANHALTRYEIDLFPITLNFKGLKLLLKMESLMDSEDYTLPGRLNWFSCDELSKTQKQNQRAFIEAWHDHYEDIETFQQSLGHHQNSFEDHYLFQEKVDFSHDPSVPHLVGETGKEKEALLELKDIEIDCLLAMAWHRKFGSDYPLNEPKRLHLLRLGWFEVEDPELVKILLNIQKIWKDAGFDILESHDRDWFRISMNPEDIFFNSELFDYELKVPEPKQWELILYVEQLNTPLGNIPESVFKCQLGTENRYKYLKSVENFEPSLDIFSEPKRELRKTIDPLTQPYGLRKLVREVQGELQMVCIPHD